MKTFLRIFRWIIKIALLVAFALFIVGWDKLWAPMFGQADLGPVQFEKLSKSSTHNQVLICPPKLCNDNDVERTSPVYELVVSELRWKFLTGLFDEHNLIRVDDRKDENKMRFVQYSRLLRFPDTIRIRFIDLGNGTSTLALYGQSQIGASDLGVNAERAGRWLGRLKEFEKKS